MLASTVDHPPAMSSPLGRGVCDATDARRVASGTLRPAPAKVEYRAPSWLAYRLVRLRTEDAEPGKCDISAVTIRAYEGIRRDLQNRPEAIASLGASSCARLSAADARLDHPRLARRTTPRAAHVGADADRAVGAGVPAPSPARFPRAVRPRRARRASSPSPPSPRGGGRRRPPRRVVVGILHRALLRVHRVVPSPTSAQGRGFRGRRASGRHHPRRAPRRRDAPRPPRRGTAHWQAQLVHRKRRRVAASRALARLARWLAPAACLVPDGPRDATARDPRFHRLVRAAAAPLVEPHEPSHDADTGGTDAKTIDDADAAKRDPARWVPSRPSRHTSTRRAVPSSRARSTTRGPGPYPRASPSRRRGRRVDSASRPRPTRTHHASPTRASPPSSDCRLRSSRTRRRNPRRRLGRGGPPRRRRCQCHARRERDARWLPGEHIDARVTRRRRRVGRTRRSFWNPPRLTVVALLSALVSRRPLRPSHSRSKPWSRKFRFARNSW